MESAAAPAKIPTSRCVEFLSRYDQMLRWSLRLTNSDRGLAQDLVHDAFLQFTLSGTDCDSIANIDHYLHEVLRNAYRTHLRQRSAKRFEQLSIVLSDSAVESRPAKDPYANYEARDALSSVC